MLINSCLTAVKELGQNGKQKEKITYSSWVKTTGIQEMFLFVNIY